MTDESLSTAEAVEETDDIVVPQTTEPITTMEASSEEEADNTETEEAPGPVGPVTVGEFTDFALAEHMLTALASMGYKAPTNVQHEVIAVALGGKDIVVQSKTGSGKTAAFGIPIIQMIEAGNAAPGEPLGLVLVPTRELASQVCEEMSRLGADKGANIEAIYGGVSINRQANALKDGVDIVVGTPGRIADHIRRGNLSLKSTVHICLDEADEMLSMGFWDDVTDLLKQAPDNKQTMLFSATLPYQVAKAAAEFLKEPARIDLSGDEVTVSNITNKIYHVHPEIPKPRQLLYLLETEQPTSAVIFCNTRNETEMIAKYLTQSGFVAEAISGNFRQIQRDKVMDRIKGGDLRYMVATDVASRGIDISGLSHVFNYSLPEFTEVYVHRVGRTGRSGNVGTAVSLVDGKALVTYRQLENEFNISFVEEELPEEQEILKRRSQRIMSELSEKASVSEVGQHLPVAKEILESEDASQVIAFLVKSYFSSAAKPRRQREDRPERSERSERAGRGRGERPVKPRAKTEDAGNREAEGEGDGKRKRRRRRGRRGRSGGDFDNAMNAAEALGLPPPANPNAAAAASNAQAFVLEAPPEGLARVRVNIGFDDGFKGRGSVAKKISSLAGLNDGILTEVEAKRDHAVLQATTDIVELLVDRVDGAQIGKKIVSVANIGG